MLASGPFCRLRCASHVHHAYFPKDCRSHSRGSKNEHGCFDAGRVFVGRMLRGDGPSFSSPFLDSHVRLWAKEKCYSVSLA